MARALHGHERGQPGKWCDQPQRVPGSEVTHAAQRLRWRYRQRQQRTARETAAQSAAPRSPDRAACEEAATNPPRPRGQERAQRAGDPWRARRARATEPGPRNRRSPPLIQSSRVSPETVATPGPRPVPPAFGTEHPRRQRTCQQPDGGERGVGESCRRERPRIKARGPEGFKQAILHRSLPREAAPLYSQGDNLE